jgi:hypothetical protein
MIDCDEAPRSTTSHATGDQDAEPSLRSFDRMSNQIKAWQARQVTADLDCEVDRADH